MRTFDKRATNLCKGIAILLMYIHHCFYTKASMSGASVVFAPFTKRQTMAFAQTCRVCVAVFVFLSAYGVYKSARGKYAFDGAFFRERYVPLVFRRYRTLLWNFAVIYVLSQLLSPLIGISRVSVYGESFWKRALYTAVDGLGLADLWNTPTYNGTWWYLPFAFLLIFLLPVLAAAVDYLGYAAVPLALLLPPLAGCSMKQTFFRYFFTMTLGLVCAKYDLMERISAEMCRAKWKFLTGAAACPVMIAILLAMRYRFGRAYLFEGANAALICFFGYAVLGRVPGLNRALAFLGKHSMNMFFIHTLVRGASSRFHAFSYAPRYPALIVLLLVADTLALSVLIEWLKKGLRHIADSGKRAREK